MARPRAVPPTPTDDSPPASDTAIGALTEHLGAVELPAGVGPALVALAGVVDRLAERLDTLEAVAAPADFAELSAEVFDSGLAERVRELEQRVHEAGRRMIWEGRANTGGRTPHPSRYLPEIGRVLLFDPETPNPEVGTDAPHDREAPTTDGSVPDGVPSGEATAPPAAGTAHAAAAEPRVAGDGH